MSPERKAQIEANILARKNREAVQGCSDQEMALRLEKEKLAEAKRVSDSENLKFMRAYKMLNNLIDSGVIDRAVCR